MDNKQKLIADFSDLILEVFDDSAIMTRGDLQGAIEAVVINTITAGQELEQEKDTIPECEVCKNTFAIAKVDGQNVCQECKTKIIK